MATSSIGFAITMDTIGGSKDLFKTVFDAAGHPVESSAPGRTSRSANWQKSFQTLYQASFSISEPLGLKKWFDGFLRTARDVLHVDRLTILLADPEGEWLQAVASTEPEITPEVIRVPIGPAGGGLAEAYRTHSQSSATAAFRCGTSIA